MKKLMAALIAVGMIAGTASAQEVLSRNAVGYVKQEINRGEQALLSVNFLSLEDVDGEYTASTLFGDQVPPGSTVYLWNPDGQAYVAENRFVEPIGWQPNTNRFRLGDSFFLSIDGAAPEESYEVFIMGEVPDATTAPSVTRSIVEGLTAVSYPYPAEITVEDSELNDILPSGATLYYWDIDTQSYSAINKFVAPIGWQPAGYVLRPGVGLFIEMDADVLDGWEELIPYTWP